MWLLTAVIMASRLLVYTSNNDGGGIPWLHFEQFNQSHVSMMDDDDQMLRHI